MATNPAGRKSRYCPVYLGPPPNQLKQSLKQFETPQLKEIPYRGSVRPSIDPSYKNTHAKADKRKGDL